MINQTVWETEWLLEYIQNNKLELHKMFIDAGCGDGMHQSNSHIFIKQGWNAILIDALRSNVTRCSMLYENYKNVTCIKATLSDKREDVFFKEDTRHWSLSKIDPAEGVATKSMRLSDILKLYGVTQIGICSIDLEGHETNVLTDLLHNRIYPQILIVEGNTLELMQQHREMLSPFYKCIGGIFPNQFFMKL